MSQLPPVVGMVTLPSVMLGSGLRYMTSHPAYSLQGGNSEYLLLRGETHYLEEGVVVIRRVHGYKYLSWSTQVRKNFSFGNFPGLFEV